MTCNADPFFERSTLLQINPSPNHLIAYLLVPVDSSYASETSVVKGLRISEILRRSAQVLQPYNNIAHTVVCYTLISGPTEMSFGVTSCADWQKQFWPSRQCFKRYIVKVSDDQHSQRHGSGQEGQNQCWVDLRFSRSCQRISTVILRQLKTSHFSYLRGSIPEAVQQNNSHCSLIHVYPEILGHAVLLLWVHQIGKPDPSLGIRASTSYVTPHSKPIQPPRCVKRYTSSGASP
ncbi:hypothetical protein CSKR_110453 [Clonorchis sinensis]|uniref:Uncharacterized protein n=1 Tax=Clonorchis sinensis TaxID=79923 RepID=A0A419Q0U4_CLOSI|nr:hypothetical protein CSKR_110453 [Clonorchis sinensis]